MEKLVYINGKFLFQRASGVQRFAYEILTHLDQILYNLQNQKKEALSFVLLIPNSSIKNYRLELKCITLKSFNWNYSLNIWEQIILPIFTFGSPLINLTGSAPFLKSFQFCTLHDVAIFRFGNSYTTKYRIFHKFLLRHLIHVSKLIFTVSNFSKSELISLFNVAENKIRVIYNSSEHILKVRSRIMPKKLILPQKFFLVIGSHNITKNVSFVIENFTENNFPVNYYLIVVGENDPKVFIRPKYKKSKKVIFFKGINDSQLNFLYKKAEALIFPSLYEGFGIPPLEAMALGCPVIASSASAIPEICGDAALYFNPKSRLSFIQTISHYLSNSHIRKDLISKGFLNANNFTWRKSSKILYDELLKFISS
jgi:glycosyltransferase involved in cell wall biosynthesis